MTVLMEQNICLTKKIIILMYNMIFDNISTSEKLPPLRKTEHKVSQVVSMRNNKISLPPIYEQQKISTKQKINKINKLNMYLKLTKLTLVELNIYNNYNKQSISVLEEKIKNIYNMKLNLIKNNMLIT